MQFFQEIESNQLFTSTDFSHNTKHKYFIIRAIVDAYVQIKGSYIAKTANLAIHKGERNNYRKHIHRTGE